MRKFKDIFPNLFPNHFKIFPRSIYVKLAEDLTDSLILADARLSSILKDTDTEIPYVNRTGTFKSEGFIKINDEYIKYTSDNGNTLSGLTRGYLDSSITTHYNSTIFTAKLANDIDAKTQTISIKDLNGDPLEIGGFTIGTEYITYRYYNKYEDTFTFYNCHRGGNTSLPQPHSQDDLITESDNVIIQQVDTIKYDKDLFTATLEEAIDEDDTEIKFINGSGYIYPNNGEIKIDNEYVRYEYIDNKTYDGSGNLVSGTFTNLSEITYNNSIYNPTTSVIKKPLLRGIKGSVADSHAINTTITELRDVEFNENGGYIKIDNEYISYWYFDDEYFYITKRGISKFKGTQPVSHTTGTYIFEFFNSNFNQTSTDLIDVISQHLDYAIEQKINNFYKLTDVSTVSSTYLPTLVNTIGENLDDYEWLRMDTRTFAQELTNIYKEKGLESSLRLWTELINNDSVNVLIDLWTMNYNNFFSLLLLIALIYVPIHERNLTIQNFYYPQISDTLYEELIEILNNVKFYGETIDNWKLEIKSWNYLNKYDDSKLGDSGFKFDTKIAPPIYTDNMVEWETSVWKTDSGFTTDLPAGSWAVNKQWIPYDPDGNTGFLKTDAVFLNSDELPEEDQIVLVHRTTGIEYEFDVNSCLDYRSDIYKHKDDLGDFGNSGSLYSSITSSSATIRVYNIDRPFYNPNDYKYTFTSPVLKPYGYIKIEDEIMRYDDIYNDPVTGISTLYNVERGKNNTTADSHDLQPFTLYDELFNRPLVKVEYDEDGNPQTDVYRILIENDPANYNVSVGDTLILDTNDSGDIFAGTFTVSNIYRKYFYDEDAWLYGIDYLDTSNPVISYSVDFTNFSDIKAKLFNWETGWQKWTEGDDRTDDSNYPNILVTVNDTRITREIEVINHKYSQYQWFLWRLLNEINGDYLKDSFYNNTGLSVAQTDVGFKTDQKLPNTSYWDFYLVASGLAFKTDALYIYDNSILGIDPEYSDIEDDILYNDISNGIIWPTSHFKWFVDIVPGRTGMTPNEEYELILYKTQEYKPKHTVMESVIAYKIGTTELNPETVLTYNPSLWISPDLDTDAIALYVPPIWVASTAYLGGDVVTATTPDGVTQYRCTIAGISHATTEPGWNTTFGVTTTDGTVTWVAESVEFSYSNLVGDNTIWAAPSFSDTTFGFTKESYVKSDMGLKTSGNYKAWFDYGAEERLPVATTGRCYDFNGVDQYVDVVGMSTNLFTSGKFSASINVQSDISGDNESFWHLYVDGNNRMDLYQDSNNKVAVYGKANSVLWEDASIDDNDLLINNFIVIMDGALCKVYKNNVEIISTVCPDYATAVGGPDLMFGYYNGASKYFTGKLSDARFFNKALTPEEVSEIYNNEYSSNVNLISNGTFGSAAGWTVVANWSIGAGVASFDGLADDTLSDIATVLEANKKYRIEFEISGAAGTPRLKFNDSASVEMLAVADYSDGRFTVEVENITAGTGFEIVAYSAGGAFDLDNIEIHEISEDVAFSESDLFLDTVAWYKMNENEGAVCLDSTSNGNTGAIINPAPDFFKPQPLEHVEEYTGNALVGGGFNTWASATDLTYWSEVIAGTSTVNREAVEVYSGDYSMRLDIDALNSLARVINGTTLTLNADIETTMSIIYKNSLAAKTASFYLQDATTSEYLQADYSWAAGVYWHVLANALDWTKVDIDFTPETTGGYNLYLRNESAASSSIYFDSVNIYQYIQPFFQTDYMFDYNGDLMSHLNAATALIADMAIPMCDVGYTCDMLISEIPALFGYVDDPDGLYTSSDVIAMDNNYPI